MISVIITAYKEPKTIGRAIEAFLDQEINEEFEILAIAPDEETRRAAKQQSSKAAERGVELRVLQDEGKGKPTALNLGFKEAKGDALVLTDGDVHVEEGSLLKLLAPLKDPKVGAVTSRPVSISPRSTKLGYWSHLLTDAGAHRTRAKRAAEGKFIVLSGYYMAIRRSAKQQNSKTATNEDARLKAFLPNDALSDDAVISHRVWQNGYKTAYAPEAKVFVKYPDNFHDWIKQKKRSIGGYRQLNGYFPGKELPRMRSFGREVFQGFGATFSYAQNTREFFWSLNLIFARAYLWYKIATLKKEDMNIDKTWKRVESTK